MDMDNIAIKVDNVYKSFGTQKVLDGINLEVERGKITVIIGKSGGGKSVLMKHLIGLVKPDKGDIWVNGVEITRLPERRLNEVRKKFGMLFQEAALFDSMSVAENVAFPLKEHTNLKEAEISRIAGEPLGSGRPCRARREDALRSFGWDEETGGSREGPSPRPGDRALR